MSNFEQIKSAEQKIKTYAEMSEEEKRKFREKKENELGELMESLKKYGAEDTEFELEETEGKLKLIIEQKYGLGITGLGYNGGKVWFCLNQEKEIDDRGKSRTKDTVNEFAPFANTVVSLESEFQGVNFIKEKEGVVKVEIDSDHPAIALAKFLENKEAQLRGGFNKWTNKNSFEFNNETGKWETEIKWDGKPAECKITVRDTEIKEGEKVTKHMKVKMAGEYSRNAQQRMEIELEPGTNLELEA